MVTSKTIDEIDEAKEKESLKKLEAIFFVSGRFLNMQQLISYTDLNPIILQELIEKLKEKLDSTDSSLEVIEKSGMWKMDLRPQFQYLVNRLATGSSEFTKAEQETLAIIAFKQPIKQSVVIKIRGNKAYDHINKFVDLGLIRKKKLGHTNELSIADDFYDYFSVQEGAGEILNIVQDSVSSNKSLNGQEEDREFEDSNDQGRNLAEEDEDRDLKEGYRGSDSNLL